MKTILVLLFVSSITYAQDWALETGYRNLGGNMFTLGTSYRVSKYYNENPFVMNGFLQTDFKKEIFPVLGLQQRLYIFFEAGLNSSPKNIEPYIGINVLNAIKTNIGYAFPINNNFKGITFGISIALGKKDYYDAFSIGF